MWSSFKKMYRACGEEYRPYRLPIAGVAVLSFVSGILEGIGINSIIPMFAFVHNASQKGTDMLSRFIEGFFSFMHIPYTLRHLLIFIFFLFAAKAAVGYAAMALTARINTAYERNTRSALYRATLRASWPHLSAEKAGHLEQVLTTDVTNSSVLLSYVSGSMLVLANLAVYLGLAMNISLLVALCTLVFGCIIFFFFKPLFYKNRAISEKVEAMYKALSHSVSEHMLGMKTIKALGAADAILKRADESFESLTRWNRSIIAVRNLTNTLLQPVGVVFVIGIFAIFYKLQAFNFASFAVIVYAINKVFAYLQTAQSQLHAIQGLLPYVESVSRYRAASVAAREEDEGARPPAFARQIEFADVRFSHTGRAATLSSMNFSIRKGEMVGIIGPSGAGKTTIVDLLLRLHRPESGAVLVDGAPLKDISLVAWREAVGYVAQDMFLLNDTIEHNIKFYHPRVTDEDMRAAAGMADADDFISRLPEGYQTIIGERGIRLSGGERQRIILARVLARKPSILILDEATSSLDNESEAVVQSAIERLKGRMTVIMIAHRLSTVMNADRLIVIEGGRVREEGSPADLLSDPNSYFSRVSALA